jgi:hypothetical protein
MTTADYGKLICSAKNIQNKQDRKIFLLLITDGFGYDLFIDGWFRNSPYLSVLSMIFIKQEKRG